MRKEYHITRVLQVSLQPVFRAWGFMVGTRHVFENKSELVCQTRPIIYVANHVSHGDAFVIQSGLPGGRRMAPIAWIVGRWYISLPLIGPSLRALGGFPSHPLKKLGYGVDEAIKRLREGFSFGIFPQGRVNQDRSTEAKWGALNVAAAVPDAVMVPIFIAREGVKFQVVVGQSFEPAGLTPRDVMDRIFRLESLLEEDLMSVQPLTAPRKII